MKKNPTLSVLGVFVLVAMSSVASASTIGLRSARELLQSMSLMTGISAREPLVVEYFGKIKSTLPVQGQATELTGEALWSITGLALAFCETGIKKESATLYPGIDFDSEASQLSNERLKGLANRFGSRFWLRTPDASELAQLLAITKIARDEASSTNELRAALVSMCASALASFDSIRN